MGSDPSPKISPTPTTLTAPVPTSAHASPLATPPNFPLPNISSRWPDETHTAVRELNQLHLANKNSANFQRLMAILNYDEHAPDR